MGANEHGVVIGNEAVFTRLPYEKTPGLIGMDFIRLALERSENALQALKTIVALLEQYGQGGNCGFAHSLYYHNSFIIADRSEAWVLETAGREWAAEKVKDIRSISNAITIDATWDMASAKLVSTAVQKGWCKSAADFSFARCYSDFIYTNFSDARHRQSCTTTAMRENKGRITPVMMMAFLRSHARSGGNLSAGLTGADVCAHASFGPVRGSQSVGSMVSRLGAGGDIHWLTGTSAPCTSIFKPVWMAAGLPDLGPAPKGTYDKAALFWRHEMLHRALLRDYATRIALIQPERDALEARFLQQAADCTSVAGQRAFSAACFAEADAREAQWLARVNAAPLRKTAPFYYTMAWKKFNQEGGM
jgi:dipeptidase